MIRRIEIENIKGISSGIERKVFTLDILPNKPSLLVAPNGFGKSSFSTAFDSLNRNRINLHEDDLHKKNSANRPSILLNYKDDGGTDIDLTATDSSNTISGVFDCFVIKNQVKAKGVGQSFGGRINVSASLNVEPIILIDSITPNTTLTYSYTGNKTSFGSNGKVLTNINPILTIGGLFIELLKAENTTILTRSRNSTVQQAILDFTSRVNAQPNSKTIGELIAWINTNELATLQAIPYMSNLAAIIKNFDLNFQINREVESYLSAIQISNLFDLDRNAFKSFCNRKEYENEKESYTTLFEDFNSTWVEFKPREKNNQLILEFPKAHLISNGQRDVLCFMALLEKAKKKLTKQNCILIIDEVFDYLDDANLVAVQYYTSQFIEEFKFKNKKIYPLILTHLDPIHFKGYVFGRKLKLKIYYLDRYEATVSEHLIKVLKQRNISTSILKNDIEKYLLHFHVDLINRRQDFDDLGLKQTWGEGNNFDNYVYGEAQKYFNDETTFDPLAVCCAVRKKIEENVYNLISEVAHQNTFLNVMTGGTNEKLDFAESIGINVNEAYSFLGIVYNEALHWKDDRDKNANISPAMGKLQNITIKKLVKSVFI
ncbi:MAG: hypothetical protein ABI549_12595 [Flavobacterium sp.]|uniref:hypothetical protein n=1 Tax=Flavobacterium sp. TaxID=239 RepID=UPI0032646D09